MGYTPYGVTGDAIRMSEKRKELEAIEKYLVEHPECNEYKEMTLEKVRESLAISNSFEFLS
ncbi:MAG: hypothetical protein K0R00_466 [Herbinix sp.]|jgi:hypothetical protein|nr:hypothetical protein [Herbinix sp.]